MEQGLYPTLDLLKEHGLRSAYVLLMLGARSTSHFEKLHNEVVDLSCRLPHNLLMALCKERQRMLGIAETKPRKSGSRGTVIEHRPSDEDLAKEFVQACGQANLGQYYWSLLSDHSCGWLVARPTTRIPGTFCLERLRMTHHVRVKRADEHGNNREGFFAEWGGFSCTGSLSYTRYIPVGGNDETPTIPVLTVGLTVKGTPNRETTKELLTRRAWSELWSSNDFATDGMFTYELDATPISRYFDAISNETTELSDELFAMLETFLAQEGIKLTNIKFNWLASQSF